MSSFTLHRGIFLFSDRASELCHLLASSQQQVHAARRGQRSALISGALPCRLTIFPHAGAEVGAERQHPEGRGLRDQGAHWQLMHSRELGLSTSCGGGSRRISRGVKSEPRPARADTALSDAICRHSRPVTFQHGASDDHGHWRSLCGMPLLAIHCGAETHVHDISLRCSRPGAAHSCITAKT